MWLRPHAWCADRDGIGDEVRRCIRCGCLSTWPLAKMQCSGASIDEDDEPARRIPSQSAEAVKTRKRRERQKLSADYHASYARDRRATDPEYAESLRRAQREYAKRKRLACGEAAPLGKEKERARAVAAAEPSTGPVKEAR